ncbi:hypothetical protein HYT05_02195 [Candidatus Kaiserbacteria bacterium]|nr:hypothetical protein [Candidatus Kaiserbacteria bacterium]
MAVFGETSEDDARQAAGHWAVEHRLVGLPIHIHRAYSDAAGRIELHTPTGVQGYIDVIVGYKPKIKWIENDALPALLRRSEYDPDGAYSAIASKLRLNIRINLIDHSGGTAHEWDENMRDGPRALANALTHASRDFLDSLGGLGRFLEALKRYGSVLPQKIDREVIQEVRSWTSGGAQAYWYLHQSALDAPVEASSVVYLRNAPEKWKGISLDELLKRIVVSEKNEKNDRRVSAEEIAL